MRKAGCFIPAVTFPSSSGQEGRLSNGKGSVQLRQGMPSGLWHHRNRFFVLMPVAGNSLSVKMCAFWRMPQAHFFGMPSFSERIFQPSEIQVSFSLIFLFFHCGPLQLRHFEPGIFWLFL
ncbi:hypothetical protein ABFY27_07540 [Akkermansia massiliensis]